MPDLATLKKHLETNIARADAALAKFSDELASNPRHAFQWADDIMVSTAARHVHSHYLAVINNWLELNEKGELQGSKRPQTEEELLTQIVESATRQALQKASFTNQSTSTCSNFMERAETAAYADLVSNWNMIW